MNLTLQQYKEILSVALDHQLMYLKGKLLFDKRDPAADQDKILRADIEKYVRRTNLEKLKKMLQSLIDGFFAFHDGYNFGQYLFDKTGYRITPIPKEQIAVSTRRSLHLSVTGKGERSITTLQILLPTDSGVIYSVRGSFPDIKAVWRADNTIEIDLPDATEELERINQVRYHAETIQILYKGRKE